MDCNFCHRTRETQFCKREVGHPPRRQESVNEPRQQASACSLFRTPCNTWIVPQLSPLRVPLRKRFAPVRRRTNRRHPHLGVPLSRTIPQVRGQIHGLLPRHPGVLASQQTAESRSGYRLSLLHPGILRSHFSVGENQIGTRMTTIQICVPRALHFLMPTVRQSTSADAIQAWPLSSACADFAPQRPDSRHRFDQNHRSYRACLTMMRKTICDPDESKAPKATTDGCGSARGYKFYSRL